MTETIETRDAREQARRIRDYLPTLVARIDELEAELTATRAHLCGEINAAETLEYEAGDRAVLPRPIRRIGPDPSEAAPKRNPATRKISEEDAVEIKRRLEEGGVTQVELAREYGVVPSTIANVRHERYGYTTETT